MRLGQNPAKSVDHVAQPAEVTVAITTYIPTLGGYYAESLELLKLCLDSLWAHTEPPFDLMVFDNASCPEVRDFLLEAHDQGRIQYLTLSDKNIGKPGAWNAIFGAAPGEFLAYADSDVYYFSGWLSPQIDLLKSLPKAGMVTGMPMLTPAEYSTATITWAESDPGVTLQKGRFLPWEDFWRHALSLGGDEAKARAFYEENEDMLVTHQGRRYYAGASHFQFVARTSVLREMLPIPSRRPMGEVRILDEKINAAGYLRLCTGQWHVQHLGNTLPPPGFLAHDEAPLPEAIGRRSRPRPFRRLAQWLYDRSFQYLYKS